MKITASYDWGSMVTVQPRIEFMSTLHTICTAEEPFQYHTSINIKTNEECKASKNTAYILWLPWKSQQASLKLTLIITKWHGITSQATFVFLKWHFGQCVQFNLECTSTLPFPWTKHMHASKVKGEMTDH